MIVQQVLESLNQRGQPKGTDLFFVKKINLSPLTFLVSATSTPTKLASM
ncbi:hypothetical protein [Pseudomonas sp. NMS19W]